jgi:hypothetical protein
VVELGDQTEELLLRDRAVGLVVEGADADLRRGLALAPDVDLGAGVVAHEHRRQSGRSAQLGGELLDLTAHSLAHPRGHGLAVDHGRGH